MASPAQLDPVALTATWSQRWPECLPVAHELKNHYPQRWVRFHSLPESRRYPRTEDEYATVLMRHRTVLGRLSGGSKFLVVTTEWSESEAPASPLSPRRAEVAPRAQHWRTFAEDAGMNPDEQIYMQLYVESLGLDSPELDPLLRAVADDELANVIMASPGLGWLYHPYDGGADVILPTHEQRDALRVEYRSWLSNHPAGL